ncbi:MAG: pyruvate ferredoxin oxidoreductase [Candidatus Moranbacteria bacterium CG_4_9_14_3_um_filter_42_9]|nr:MAG: pyruvate ferredoxin oxidoreductase [Candidatus Moranbacteria bacterium CG_4_9_14_3_um_filter_42_9]
MEKGAVIKHDIKKAPRTGDWRYLKPEVDEKKCIACGTCVKFCPEAVISLEACDMKNATALVGSRYSGKTEKNIKSKKVAEIDYDFCKGCGVCANVCPSKAIVMKKI